MIEIASEIRAVRRMPLEEYVEGLEDGGGSVGGVYEGGGSDVYNNI